MTNQGSKNCLAMACPINLIQFKYSNSDFFADWISFPFSFWPIILIFVLLLDVSTEAFKLFNVPKVYLLRNRAKKNSKKIYLFWNRSKFVVWCQLHGKYSESAYFAMLWWALSSQKIAIFTKIEVTLKYFTLIFSTKVKQTFN